jgi:ribose 5-phosphate isomerase B
MRQDIATQVITVIANVLDAKPSDIKPQDRFQQDLGANSLDLAELIWRLEDDPSLGLGQLPEEVFSRFVCVQDVIDYLERHAPAQAPAVSGARPRVVIASDHSGYALKAALLRHLEQRGEVVKDVGSDAWDEVDFPEYAESIARMVVAGEAEFGVLIGSTGIGMSIAANKVAGARAAVVADLLGARLSRQRYDVNILCLGAALLGEEAARHCVGEFLDTPFVAGADGRYRRQISRLHEIERRRP